METVVEAEADRKQETIKLLCALYNYVSFSMIRMRHIFETWGLPHTVFDTLILTACHHISSTSMSAYTCISPYENLGIRALKDEHDNIDESKAIVRAYKHTAKATRLLVNQQQAKIQLQEALLQFNAYEYTLSDHHNINPNDLALAQIAYVTSLIATEIEILWREKRSMTSEEYDLLCDERERLADIAKQEEFDEDDDSGDDEDDDDEDDDDEEDDDDDEDDEEDDDDDEDDEDSGDEEDNSGDEDEDADYDDNGEAIIIESITVV